MILRQALFIESRPLKSTLIRFQRNGELKSSSNDFPVLKYLCLYISLDSQISSFVYVCGMDLSSIAETPCPSSLLKCRFLLTSILSFRKPTAQSFSNAKAVLGRFAEGSSRTKGMILSLLRFASCALKNRDTVSPSSHDGIVKTALSMISTESEKRKFNDLEIVQYVYPIAA